MSLYDGDIFERGGLKFRFRTEFDDNSGPPWEEECGHGEVSEWTTRDKKPGERELCQDRGSKRFYDWAESTRVAKRDGWGLTEDDTEQLTKKLRRTPTRGQIVHAAVQRDYEYLRSWANNEWHYIGVIVTLLEEGEDGELVENDGIEESLCGIDDSDDKYIEETAYEMADAICAQVKRIQPE